MKQSFILTGVGDLQQQEQIAVPLPPQQDNTLLWASSVIVPVVVALIGLWAMKHRRN